MPILPGSSTTDSPILQSIVNEMRAYPEFQPVLGTAGYSDLPSLSIANDLMQRIMSEPMAWIWNRSYIQPFLTVGLQQDYVTQITDIGWLENCTRIDINNSANSGNRAAKPIQEMEAIRDQQPTSRQGTPFQISFIPNRQAIYGQWQPNTTYGCSYGVPQMPLTPIQQFVDDNGNILYIDSTVLGLDQNSPGYAGQTITLPDNNPYGVSGDTKPCAPAAAPPGTTVQDGSVIWTVGDINGYALRLNPVPAYSSVPWLVCPIYQVRPPTLKSLRDTISPIPPDMTYLFRQGFRAMLYEHAASPKAQAAYAKWEEDLVVAVRGADRQQESYSIQPGQSIMSGGYGGSIGPANPYGNCW